MRSSRTFDVRRALGAAALIAIVAGAHGAGGHPGNGAHTADPLANS
jgi:hypothetical protein